MIGVQPFSSLGHGLTGDALGGVGVSKVHQAQPDEVEKLDTGLWPRLADTIDLFPRLLQKIDR